MEPIVDYIKMHAALRPNKRAVVDLSHDHEWTFKEYDVFIARLVTFLEREGVQSGDRVACLSKSRAEVIALHHACARKGAIFVPLNWRLSAQELAQLLDDCEPSLLILDDFAVEKKLVSEEGAIAQYSIANLIADTENLLPNSSCKVDMSKPSLILYTSGTTGKPKGVVLTETNIFETAMNSNVLYEVDEKSAFLSEGPMFHIIGIISSIRPVFSRGGHVCISDSFIPERTLSYMADLKLGITHYFCVPQMAHAIRDAEGFTPEKINGLKAMYTGGAPLPAAQILDWIEDDLLIVNGYGSTEAGTVYGMPLNKETTIAKAGSVGLSGPRLESKIIDDSGIEVAQGEAGELLLRGPSISAGYWKKDGGYTASQCEDGWFSTGDILSQDEDGYFRVMDRKKDMYISGGENVYPAEVEAHTVKYPGLIEQSIVGVPDEKWGEVGCLFYVSKNVISLEEVLSYLGNKIARYKLPHHVRRIDQIPRNSAGKVLKHELRKMAITAD